MKHNILVLFLLLALAADIVLGIGVSPPQINADHMDRGSHMKKEIYLSGINEGDKVTIRIDGEAKDWITMDMGTEFIYPEGRESFPIEFMVNVPSDTPNGKYEATAIISSSPLDTEDFEGASSSVIAGVTLTIMIDVTGEQVSDYSILSATMPDIEEDSPIQLFLDIENNGNVIAKPAKVEISILDKLKETSIISGEMTLSGQVESHKRDIVTGSMDNELEVNQYWASVKVYNDDDEIIHEEDMTFDVVEEGSLSKSGTLKKIELPEEVNEGETIKIEALFHNTGDMAVSSKFAGEIYREDDLIEAVKSDVLNILPKRDGNLVVYFKPEETGEYILKGHVNYDGTNTEENEVAFEVVGEGESNARLYVMAAIGIVIIVAIIWKTRRKRK